MQPAFTLHGALHASTERDPDGVAVTTAAERWTHAELTRRAGQIATALGDLGVVPGDRVAVAAEKSPAALAALYGIMAAGAAYIPIDPFSPPMRAARIVTNAGCAAACVDGGGAEKLRAGEESSAAPKILALDDAVDRPDASVADTADLPPRPLTGGCESDLAYILYTSGSTGEPKGVMLTHRNALAFVDWGVWRFDVSSEDRLSSHAPFHFDLSVFDLYAAARCGAPVRLLSKAESAFGRSMVDLIEAEQITVWYSVPSALALVIGVADPEQLVSLRVVLFAGEVFATKHLQQLRGLVPKATLANLYGPTETNVCTYWVAPPTLLGEDPIPIGRACENQEVFALDDRLHPVPVGEVGELWVRGPTVMQGYFGDTERTAQTRQQNPLHDRFPDPCYRTGDLVRVGADGELLFLGRRDHQIKTRGYRVELGEIEAALVSHPSVREVAVVAVPDEKIGNALIGFVAAAESVDELELKRQCAERVPRYMVPSTIHLLAELPHTSTGKIDRQALRARTRDGGPTRRGGPIGPPTSG